MAYDNKRSFPERDKNMLDDRRIGLSAPTPGVKGKWSNLNWGYFGNLARLTCWTNDPEDQKKKIDVKMPPLDFCKFLVLLEMAIDLPETGEDKFWMDVRDYSWYGKEKSKEVETQGLLYVGKKDGVVWMSLIAKDKSRPKIKFAFGNTMYNVLYGANGEPLSDAVTSVIVAKANAMLLKQAVPGLAIRDYKEKPKDDTSGGGGGQRQSYGGGGNGGSNSGRGNNDDAPDAGGFDDDVPF